MALLVTGILGVDGGNSKTIALVAGLDGQILGVGRSGASDIYGAVTADAALAALEDAVECALQSAGMTAADMFAAAFSLAGADWPEDIAFLYEEVRRRGYGRTIQVVNDALGALRAGSSDGIGVSVVCGTGAAIGARGRSGRVWHTSWWQEPQGSIQLAHQALRAVYRAELGIGIPTALTHRAKEVFDQGTVEDILRLFTRRLGHRPDGIGAMAAALLDEAALGDELAARIVREHGWSLGDYALAAAREVYLVPSHFTLVLAGGVFRHPSTILQTAIVERVRAGTTGITPVVSALEPAVGAVLLALEAADIAVDAGVRRRIESSMPPAILFAT